MKIATILVLFLTFYLFKGPNLLAEELNQRKDELKKIYQAGGISKVEYENSLKTSEQSNQEEEITKKTFAFKKQNKENKFVNIFKKDKDLEKITLEKIEELGKPIQFDDTYYTKGMIKEFKSCSNSFKCRGDKAGQELFKTFNKSKSYGQKNPGKMIKAMAMYEVFYASKLWYARKNLERYKNDDYGNIFFPKENDEKEIRSLIGMHKGRKAMRSALGMNSETPTKEAIKKFWLLGEFLDLGTGVNKEKLAKDLKKRQELLEAYKLEIVNLKKKLQEDLEEEENEKSVQ